ncbi:MAG: TPR end-of-group domain-containing protein [Gammaproteobacteria bacterium]
MSILNSLTKRSRLNSAIKQTKEARKSEGGKADYLFKKVYEDYADIVHDDPLRAEALYFWGHALLHQAKTKSGEEAASLYRDAILKFAFSLTLEPNYLAAAIDGGVCYMDLARLQGAAKNSDLYAKAQQEFERANSIQAGAASYNLACIHALRGEHEACLRALEHSRDKGSLPDTPDIVNDPDMASVQNQAWFIEFLESRNKPAEPEQTAEEVAEEASAETEEDKTEADA